MARVDDLIVEFENMLAADTLPQVMWIVGPANVSEHATWWPSAGEDFTARILKTLAAHPDVYAKTAFILNYDEGGQFFDHATSPVPPMPGAGLGVSNIPTTGEVNPVSGGHAPIGPGFRVPALVISPWSRGHAVVSEVFDHTSVLRFVEERFGVHCPNISPWRRAISGNLMSAFDWANPDYSWPTLPDTSGYVAAAASECAHLPPPKIPAEQAMPVQEPGTRLSRPLPYAFMLWDVVSSGKVTITIGNLGTAGGAFNLVDALPSNAAPRQYGVAVGTNVSDTLPAGAGGAYAYALHGANGFLRVLTGVAKDGAPSASCGYSGTGAAARVIVSLSAGASGGAYTVVDKAYGVAGVNGTLPAGGSTDLPFDMTHVGNWYDFSVTWDNGDSRRCAGRMETGVAGISDPAMAAGVPGWASEVATERGLLPKGGLVAARHPPLPEAHRVMPRALRPEEATHKDAASSWNGAREEL